jgi:hypothetical protein
VREPIIGLGVVLRGRYIRRAWIAARVQIDRVQTGDHQIDHRLRRVVLGCLADNCRYYLELREGIGYCAHRQLEMVVGAPWWWKLWAPNRATAAARGSEPGKP